MSEDKKFTPLPAISASSLFGTDVPRREWLLPDWIPLNAVTLLAGDGGTGKSLVALQLAAACATGNTFLGLRPLQCPSLVLACEDDFDEIHRRLADIASAGGFGFDALDDLQIVSGFGQDAVIYSSADNNRGYATPRLQEIRDHAVNIGARLIVLDTAGNLFAGDENSRAVVTAFISALTGLAIELQAAVVLLAHPSKSALQTGAGYSGSTAWQGTVRARLNLEAPPKPKPGSDEPTTDPKERTLSVGKSNYGANSLSLRIKWDAGVFVALDSPDSFDRAVTANRADRVFLELLATHAATHVNVSAAPTANNFAPTVFARHPNSQGVKKNAFKDALARLLANKTVVQQQYDSPKKEKFRLIIRTE